MSGHAPARRLRATHAQVDADIRRFGAELEAHPLHPWFERIQGTVVEADAAFAQFQSLFERAWRAEELLRELQSLSRTAGHLLDRSDDITSHLPSDSSAG